MKFPFVLPLLSSERSICERQQEILSSVSAIICRFLICFITCKVVCKFIIALIYLTILDVIFTAIYFMYFQLKRTVFEKDHKSSKKVRLHHSAHLLASDCDTESIEDLEKHLCAANHD